MDSVYYRRFTVSFSVVCLWLFAAVVAYWPWSFLILGGLTISAIIVVKGVRNGREQRNEAR